MIRGCNMKIGYDLGYGYAKLVYGRDYQVKVFPSVLAKADQFADDGRGFGDYTLQIDGEKYYVGNAALLSKSKLLLSAFDGNRINNKVFYDLFLAGIASCIKYDDEEIYVATGLPISAYKAHRKEIAQYKGKHITCLNNKALRLNLAEIMVIPQPLGTYFKLLNAYPELKRQSILIVDIGFKTTDLFRIEQDIPLPSSTTLHFGMSDIARDVIDYANGRIDGKTYTINQADDILDNGFIVNGKRQFIPEEIQVNSLRNVFNAIWARIVELFPDYGTFDRIIFTGGSSLRFREFISSIPLESMAISSDAQLANAIGYRDMLEWCL